MLQNGDKVDNIFTAKFALLDAYLANTEMYNCYNAKPLSINDIRPLAIIAKHKQQKNLNTLWKAKVTQFARAGIYELFGLSLTEAFKFPVWKLDELIEIAEKIQKEKSNSIKGLQNDLKNMANGKL